MRTCVACTGLALAAGTARGQGGEPESPYRLLRFEEDWSTHLGGDGLIDSLKHVPFGDSGSYWSLGGSLRARAELWDGLIGGSPPPIDDDDWALLDRATLHGDLRFSNGLRVFGEVRSALDETNDLYPGRRPIDHDTFAFQNLFLDVPLPELAGGDVVLRVGRQEMAFGKELFVSPFDWRNVRQGFDGARGTWTSEEWTVDAFFTRPVEVDKYDLNDTDDDEIFHGLYVTRGPVTPDDLGWDVYWLLRHRGPVSYNGTAGKEERHTVGGRVFGEFPDDRIDYDGEWAYQFGEVGTADIDACGIAMEVGWRTSDDVQAPRVYTTLDYGAGDQVAGDDDVQTFQRLFGDGHSYLGITDTVGFGNVLSFGLGCSWHVTTDVEADVRGLLFRREDDADGLYDSNGNLSVGPGGGSQDIGQELDLVLRYPLDRHNELQFGYGHLFAGDYLDGQGIGDVDFAFLSWQFTF